MVYPRVDVQKLFYWGTFQSVIGPKNLLGDPESDIRLWRKAAGLIIHCVGLRDREDSLLVGNGKIVVQGVWGESQELVNMVPVNLARDEKMP